VVLARAMGRAPAPSDRPGMQPSATRVEQPGEPGGSPIALPPRIVVAGTHSGVGKTTVATGLMAALTEAGVRVGAAKVGPDFVDPGYHRLATGRPSRNLDPWLCGNEGARQAAAMAGEGAELLVVEGVMGLFDGIGAHVEGSTAHVAELIDAPVVLVVDAAAMSGSVAALVGGFAHHRPTTRVEAVVLNRVGSARHAKLLIEALRPLGVPVAGWLPRDVAFAWRERHLGLVPVVEEPHAARRALRRLAAAVRRHLHLEELVALARRAPRLLVAPRRPARRAGAAVVAVASGPAFSFVYPDNLERLEEAGGELVSFDPLVDEQLPPATQGVYVGGGFPEVYAERLAANEPMLRALHERLRAGACIWAECGGLLWLCETLDGVPMARVLAARARMTDRLALGYREATARYDSPVVAAGTTLRGHEFHYSTTDPSGDALELRWPGGGCRSGFATDRMLASYLHLHLGADPAPAERFVAHAARCPQGERAPGG
jgi:cobyrinic acid a,c-diamide synthase